MRIAYTIILNGKRHLLHNNYYEQMLENFDKWVVVEGVALNQGSTSWCKVLPDSFHNNFLSNDGTTEFLDNIKSNKLTIIRNNNKPWSSKDEQVNAAIEEIKKQANKCFLWQIDIDEQWTPEKLAKAENIMEVEKAKTGCFLCNFFVGKNQIVLGDWGEGKYLPYRRLWRWDGENFKCHEPPTLNGKNGPGILIPVKFNHYAYYFEEDVIFKENYYSGYDGLLDRWKSIQNNKSRIHVKHLLGPNTWWANTNTIIKYAC